MSKKGLKWGAVLRLGLHGLRDHKLRVFVVILLTVISLTLMGMGVTAATFNEDKARVQSYLDNELSSEVYAVDGDGEALPLTQSNFEELYTATGVRFSGVIMGEELPYDSTFYNCSGENLPTCLQRVLFGLEEQRYCHATEQALSDAGFTLYGSLPQNEFEIAVNSCMLEVFIGHGFYDEINYPMYFDETHNDYERRSEGYCKISSARDLVDLGVSMYLYDLDSGELAPAKIVGVVDYGECETRNSSNNTRGYYDAVFVSDTYFEKLTLPYFGEEGAGLIAVSGKMPSFAAAKALIEFCENNDGYELSSPLLEEFKQYSGAIATSMGSFTAIGVVFCAFAALLIYQFTALSVEEKRDQVGVLRALGAHSSDVYRVFLSESLFLALVSVAFALPLTWLACLAVNALLPLLSINLSFMLFGAWAVVFEVAVAIVVTLAATFFPVYRLAKKQPVECIRRGS